MKKPEIVAILLSSIAISLSLVTYWNDTLKPFKLDLFDAGRVELTVNPYKAPNMEPAILVELIFINKGAKTGFVQDAALKLKFPNGEDYLFRSIVVSTDRTLQFGENLEPPKLESFVGFNIPGRNSVYKHIMFVPDKPIQTDLYPAGIYNVEIFAISGGKKDWKSFGSFSFSVDNNDLEILSKMAFTKEPDGRYFIKWYTQSKVTETRESSLESLKNLLK